MLLNSLPSYQDQLSKPLAQINEGRFPHAFLINCNDGVPGVRAAQILAQTILCQEENKPCGKCNSCKLLFKNNHPDLHYSFPYANTTGKSTDCSNFLPTWHQFISTKKVFLSQEWVERLESGNKQNLIYTAEGEHILKSLSLKPYLGNNRVLIIWQSELLHNSTANKLLKFIEEPLPQTYIILISHKLENTLKTILSRCQIFNLQSISNDTIENDIEKLGLEKNPNLIKISHGNLGLYNYLTHNQVSLLNTGESFLKWLRTSFLMDIPSLLSLSESLAKESRESLIAIIDSFLEHIRAAFLYNEPNINKLCLVDLSKLSSFVNENNVHQIQNEIQILLNNLHRNANAKIALFDTSLKIGKLLKA